MSRSSRGKRWLERLFNKTRQEDEQNDVPVRDPGAPRYCTLSRCTDTIAIDLQACRDQGFESFRHSDTLLFAYPLADSYNLTSTNRPTF
jgi:hypothetical protein